MSEKPVITPLPIVGLADYHVHCDYSVDAEGSIDDFCDAALKRRLTEICFTTHYDTNPSAASGDCFIRFGGKNHPASPDNLEPYVAEVLQANDKYYSLGVSVKLGVEIGWWDGCAESVARLRERFAFDHVLCGVHEVDNRDICSPRFSEYFKNYPIRDFAAGYFQQAVDAARTGLFDAIAHLGYYVRFGYAHYGESIYKIHEPLMNKLFEALRQSDTSLEVNTSAIRHGFHHYYPHMPLLNAARTSGVEVRFLGSDAHRPEQIGLDFDAASALVPDTAAPCED
ncbi:MAG TPA: histidinol-phosphatase HisJ family protein [Candidatus Deferrimicrobium sp.]|nr:histidinol-phosphatase HisJ family protein [Candidatus Deferrimicrobium sp.]